MTDWFPELGPVLVWFRRQWDAARNRGEEGLTTAEWVVLIAAAVGMALAAGALIYDKVIAKGESINLD